MDRSQDVLASLSSAVFAGLRAATVPGRSRRDGESDGLLNMLTNPDFIPPPLRGDHEVRNHPATAYDDLPPLEDDVELPSASNASEHSLPVLPSEDDDEPPPLEADDSSPVVTSSLASPDIAATSSSANASIATSGGTTSSVRPAIPNDASTPSAQPSTSPGMPAVSINPGRPPSRPARATVNVEDDGAESDSSLPSLQSVSDSSSDAEDYMSESGSDWDDDESLDDSEGESDLARLVEEAETVAPDAPHNPTGPSPPAAAGVHPELGATYQSYRELLDRARVLIPNIEARLSPDWVLDITNRLSSAGRGADNDAERAETLIRAMEVVPDELVLRYEKLRSSDGEDVDGCAICRDGLVDKSPDTIEASRVLAIFALLPFPFESVHSVAFPCAGKHLFHKHCLLPWLARKTTCPSCRFDIDPHSLTLRVSRGLLDALSLGPEADPTHPPHVWQPPQVESMRDWVEAEERAKGTGIPRVRPDVVMPEYSTVSPPTGTSISEVLGFTAWGTNPDTGRFDMTTAYRDIQDLREQLLDMEERRRAAGLPTRPPSAPPVPTAEAPVPTFLEGMFGGGRAHPARDPEYERLRQQIAIERHGPHLVPFHNFPASLMDHVVNLTTTPLSRGSPPNNVEVDVLAHAGNRLGDLSSIDMYSQVLRDFQNRRRSVNPPPPVPVPVVPVGTAPPQNNPAPTAAAPIAPATPNIPHPVLGEQEGLPAGLADDVPPPPGHDPMEELD